MTVTERDLDRFARALAYRLDILTTRQEVAGGWCRLTTLHNRITTLATSYGKTEDQVERDLIRERKP